MRLSANSARESSCQHSFRDFDFGGREGVKVIDQGVNLSVRYNTSFLPGVAVFGERIHGVRFIKPPRRVASPDEELPRIEIVHRGHEPGSVGSAGVLACGFTRRLVGCGCWRRGAAPTRSRDDCATLAAAAVRMLKPKSEIANWQ